MFLFICISLVYLFYAGFIWRSINLWKQLPKESSSDIKAVSVIVPFRNEALHLERVVKSLNRQDHMAYEVIFVNDHSEDVSETVLLDALKGCLFNYRIFHLKDEIGKKAALAYGISQARNEFIVTTDADCLMGEKWLTTLSAGFSSEIHMVSGPIGLLQKSVLSKMACIEVYSLVGLGAAAIQKRRPTMANGANLAFRKRIFEELGGYKDISESPSGDDELLMAKIDKAYPNSIRFCKNSDAVVVTEPPASLSKLVAQKVRWASKWKVGARPAVKRLAILIGLLQMVQIALIISMVLNPNYILWGAMILATRYLFEYAFSTRVSADLLLTRPSVGLFTLSFIIYPFYAIYIALLANFGTYSWKGRLYK